MKEYIVKVYKNHTEWYNKEGQLHRENGPAREYTNGSKSWYLNGQLHRENGPAREWANGSKSWYLNGQRHREDGPAVEWIDETKQWYLNGKYLTEVEFNERMNLVVEMTVEEISKALGKNVKIVKG